MSRPGSRRPDPSIQGTTLQRDNTRRPSNVVTRLERDDPRRPSNVGTRLERDQPATSSSTNPRPSYQAPTAAPPWGQSSHGQPTQRPQPSMAQQSSHQSSSTSTSTRPPPGSTSRAKGSTLVTKLDRDMAQRQTKIEVLPEKERAKQEKWAAQQLSQNSGNCPLGFTWNRIIGGYQCDGGSHFVSDALLQEGMRGYIQGFRDGSCDGPLYKDEYNRIHAGSLDGPLRDYNRPGQYPGGLAAIFPNAGRLPGVPPSRRREGWTMDPDGNILDHRGRVVNGMLGGSSGIGGLGMGSQGGLGGSYGMFPNGGGYGGSHGGYRY